MKFRKVVATLLMTAIFFWAPSMVPVRAAGPLPCGIVPAWLPGDTAFAIPVFVPCPTPATTTPWGVVGIGAAALSVIVNAAVVSATQCRELTQLEAFQSFFLPFIGILFNQKKSKCP
jgi:hypothetical protein